MRYCNPRFEKYLEPFTALKLDKEDCVAYGVWDDLRLAYLNPGWFTFAKHNGGEQIIKSKWGLGRSILDAIPPVLHGFYTDAYATSLNSKVTWEHTYECHSPVFKRWYRQIAYPLDGKALLITNILSFSKEHELPVGSDVRLIMEDYQNQHGIITQCCHCRKTHNKRLKTRWDWIGDWVGSPPNTISHGICPLCFNYYYPGLDLA